MNRMVSPYEYKHLNVTVSTVTYLALLGRNYRADFLQHKGTT